MFEAETWGPPGCTAGTQFPHPTEGLRVASPPSLPHPRSLVPPQMQR